MEPTNSTPSNGQPRKPKFKNPWDGLTKAEHKRRVAKMLASRREKREAKPPERVDKANGTRRTFNDAQRQAYVDEIDTLVAGGMMVKDACVQAGVAPTQYRLWKSGQTVPPKNGKRDKALDKSLDAALLKHLPAVRRPPQDQIEILDVPAPRANGHRGAEPTRLDRLAALIVAVEKLL